MHIQYCCSLVVAMVLCGIYMVSGECAAPAPCTCYGTTQISCSGKALNATPTFQGTAAYYDLIDLSFNNITRIEAGAFSEVIHAGDLAINLNNNPIYEIEELAFAGLENTTLHLQLASNNLGAIPAALGKLTALFSLTINGVTSMDSSVMKRLGLSLEILDIGMGNLTNWPTEMKYLVHLKRLYMNTIPALPGNAFDSFGGSLEYLNIYNSTLVRSPDTICSLIHLKRLYFSGVNLDISPSKLIPNCPKPLVTVNELYFERMDLAYFPDIFSLFLKLSLVTVKSSNTRRVDDHVVLSHPGVTSLDLTHNKLIRIPSAINKVHLLQILNLEHNMIASVEANDVKNMANLVTIRLDNNPIEYISEHAFVNSSAISKLSLAGTNLRSIPAVVLHLPHLQFIWLQGTSIECSCDFHWLTHWGKLNEVTFYGDCYRSTETISHFLSTELHLCDPVPVG